MQKELIQEAGSVSEREIFMMYVTDGFDKNTLGAKLLELEQTEIP